MAIDGKVYDVTKFLDDHPGGGDVMVSSSGRDASDDFEARALCPPRRRGGSPDPSASRTALSGRRASPTPQDVGHSRHARKMMEEYLIGDFEGGRASKSAKASEGSGLGVLLPILVVLIAFAVYYMKSLNP